MGSLYCAAKIMRETTRSNIKVKRLFFTLVVRNHNLLTHKPEKYAPSYIEHSPIRAIFFEGFVSF